MPRLRSRARSSPASACAITPAQAARQGSPTLAEDAGNQAPVSTSPMPGAAIAGLPRSQRPGIRPSRSDQRASPLQNDDRAGVALLQCVQGRHAIGLNGGCIATQQPAGFARMRRQHRVRRRWPAAAGEQIQRVGIERPAACRRQRRARTSISPNPTARDPVRPPRRRPVRAVLRAPAASRTPCTISSGRPATMALRLSPAVATVTRPAPTRRQLSPASRTAPGMPGPPPTIRYATEIALVRLAARRGKRARDLALDQPLQQRRKRASAGGRHLEIVEQQPPDQLGPVAEKQAGLERDEADRAVRADRRAHDRAAVGVQSRRQIERKHRPIAALIASIACAIAGRTGSRKPGAEQASTMTFRPASSVASKRRMRPPLARNSSAARFASPRSDSGGRPPRRSTSTASPRPARNAPARSRHRRCCRHRSTMAMRSAVGQRLRSARNAASAARRIRCSRPCPVRSHTHRARAPARRSTADSGKYMRLIILGQMPMQRTHGSCVASRDRAGGAALGFDAIGITDIELTEDERHLERLAAARLARTDALHGATWTPSQSPGASCCRERCA